MCARRLRPLVRAVRLHGLGELALDRHQRIEARHRLLEDHGDLGAAQRPQRPLVGVRKLVGAETDRAVDLQQCVGQKPHDRARDHGLARAAFPDQREELPRQNTERHVLDDLEARAIVPANMQAEFVDGQDRLDVARSC